MDIRVESSQVVVRAAIPQRPSTTPKGAVAVHEEELEEEQEAAEAEGARPEGEAAKESPEQGCGEDEGEEKGDRRRPR
jgi:hypothetical protein